MNQSRVVHLLFSLTLLLSSSCFAVPPDRVIQDVSQLDIVRSFPTVSAMPPQLRRALARAFNQPRLELANPSAPYKQMSMGFAGDPEAGLPRRRLLLAFETPRHYFVYYEVGHPSHAAAIAFNRSGSIEIVWGAGDLAASYARSPRELRGRILHRKLIDDPRPIW